MSAYGGSLKNLKDLKDLTDLKDLKDLKERSSWYLADLKDLSGPKCPSGLRDTRAPSAMGWWNTSRGEIPRQSARGQSAVSTPDRGSLIVESFGVPCKDVEGGCVEVSGGVWNAAIGRAVLIRGNLFFFCFLAAEITTHVHFTSNIKAFVQ